MTFDRELFAGNLRANRARLKISQQELADRCGISQNTVTGYENGVFIPNIEKACKLADVFGVSLESLVRGSWDRPESG